MANVIFLIFKNFILILDREIFKRMQTQDKGTLLYLLETKYQQERESECERESIT